MYIAGGLFTAGQRFGPHEFALTWLGVRWQCHTIRCGEPQNAQQVLPPIMCRVFRSLEIVELDSDVYVADVAQVHRHDLERIATSQIAVSKNIPQFPRIFHCTGQVLARVPWYVHAANAHAHTHPSTPAPTAVAPLK